MAKKWQSGYIKIGARVCILEGKYKGSLGFVSGVHRDKFTMYLVTDTFGTSGFQRWSCHTEKELAVVKP